MSSNPRKHVHLGTRLEAAEAVRSGASTPEREAARLGVDADEVRIWATSRERPVSFEEVLVSPEEGRLTRRARRLVALIEDAEVTIRELTRRLAARSGLARPAAE
jgi:hypothetical protein